MKRGDVYLANLSPTRGSEQAGIRPVVIVQHDELSKFTQTLVAVPFTTNIRRAKVPGTIIVSAGEGGLTQDSVALCYQITVLDEKRLISKLGELSSVSLAALNLALKRTLNLS